MAWRDDVTLHRQSLLHALTTYDLGPTPAILTGREVWLPQESRAKLEEAVTADLADADVLVGAQLREDFASALMTVAYPASGYFAWVQHEEYGRYGVAVSCSGTDCVLLLRRGEWTRLLPAAPDALAETLLAEIPDFEIHRDDTINLPESETPWATDEISGAEARRLDTLLKLPRYGGGQIHALPASDTRSAVTYLDTAAGRWLLSLDTANQWVTATPAHPDVFLHHLDALGRSDSRQRHVSVSRSVSRNS
ncbi:ESX secretion-associated protein EspG [Amycolatopsis cihanbeyliensis]|uniref:ESAT-6 protein secretion system EspG family protein n=1 Tax=Amycolatopsis cihanbeyliensis TaxID=1128664 RepID=A0A542CV00_AMYCI|nr:ESX secretion-associated protein EspG [Amycolatopsis cihanbeyliensis]TQI94647.1 ESAT-6 protein secretion system EspG family protein [Amycolatopsis cihanbeyliensis]